ncbi:tyrosine-type recombinase/integrase [Nocardia sp. NBC_01499]|uniref:tyrosine-type recombinase/integrase n=1 Tax=Nocardia sp. NBC_01499 TaxID=2903597 RepID=UPI003863AF7F
MGTSSDIDVTFAGDDLVLRLACAAYLGRFTGSSRIHCGSDLRLYFCWCTERQLLPLSVVRAEVERYVRWMRVIDGVIDHSPAEYVRRPRVPNESPTLGLSHLQFEALLTAARDSVNPFDFALTAMLGLLGLRIFEACNSDVDDVGEEHGHRVLRVIGKGSKLALIPLPPAVGRAIDRATGDRVRGPILLNTRGRRMDRHCATRRLRRLAQQSPMRLPHMHPHMLRHTFVTTMLDAGVGLRECPDRRASRRSAHHHAL